jgi:hypothetical protein
VHQQPRLRVVGAATAAGAVLVLTLTGCGVRTSSATYVGDPSVAAVAQQVGSDGRTAYYLGPEAGGLPLTDVTRVTDNGPDFQVWATYGTCVPAPLDQSACVDPISVSTMDWRPDGTGVTCQRLEPQLGVPAVLISGELILFTGQAQVRVIDTRGPADDDGHRGLALLKDLRSIGAGAPAGTLPPPDPEVAQWVDDFCGTVPGGKVDHPIDEEPATITAP